MATGSNAFSLARRLRDGETVFTGWCALGAPIIAELCAREGFTAVTLDQQHGLFDMAATAAGIAAIRAAGAAPIVRVPLGDVAVASRVLDLGAAGVIAPMINTAEDARALVSATKYPPIGDRSWGPNRALMLTGGEARAYLETANVETLTIAMVETRAAIDNRGAILSNPGIDAIFIGPSDLSIALTNGKTLDPHSREVEAELDRLVAAAQSAGKIPGAYCASAERARDLSRRGFRFIAVASDAAFLRAGIGATVAALNQQ